MEAVDTKQYIIVNLGKDMYGIDIKYIENIIVMQNITRVPKAQPYFNGVINLRGEVVPVMSLRVKLGQAEDEFKNTTRIIIVRPEPQASPIGIIVDAVKEVVTLENSNIENVNFDDKDAKANYSVGIGKIGSELINLLNIPAIVIEKEAIIQ